MNKLFWASSILHIPWSILYWKLKNINLFLYKKKIRSQEIKLDFLKSEILFVKYIFQFLGGKRLLIIFCMIFQIFEANAEMVFCWNCLWDNVIHWLNAVEIWIWSLCEPIFAKKNWGDLCDLTFSQNWVPHICTLESFW